MVTNFFFSWCTPLEIFGNVAYWKTISNSNLSFLHHWKSSLPNVESGACSESLLQPLLKIQAGYWVLANGIWGQVCKGSLGKSLLPSRKSCVRGKAFFLYSGHGNVCCSHLGTIIKSITNMDCREERSQSSLSLWSYKVNLRTLNFCYNRSPLSIMSPMNLSQMAFTTLRYVFSILNLLRDFIMQRCWILSNVFSVSIEMIKWFWSFITLIWYNIFIGLYILSRLCHLPEINITSSWCMSPLMSFWIQFASIYFVENICIHIHQGYWSAIFFSCNILI